MKNANSGMRSLFPFAFLLIQLSSHDSEECINTNNIIGGLLDLVCPSLEYQLIHKQMNEQLMKYLQLQNDLSRRVGTLNQSLLNYKTRLLDALELSYVRGEERRGEERRGGNDGDRIVVCVVSVFLCSLFCDFLRREIGGNLFFGVASSYLLFLCFSDSVGKWRMTKR
jgi:hypothetical protein